MWRWSLHKKVERDPRKSPALVRILLRELEKAEREDLRHVIIPLLHTLMYVLAKATGITEELYRRTYAFCTRLLTLPAPYSTVALDCAIRLKTETAVPGTLYQRLVIAEQNLTSELYPYQERVFLFVDPELVSPSVCSALLLEIEAAQVQQTPEACMRHVVSHALQAALGEACHMGALQRKLQASPRRTLVHYFHAVVAAVEQMASEPNPSREGHLERLEEIYSSLLGPAAAARGRCGGNTLQDQPPSIPLPSPHISFHLWTDEEQLWKELVLFLRPHSQLRLSANLEALDLQGLLPDLELARASVLSTDSGIERDLPLGADELPSPSSPEMERGGLQRKGGIKKRAWPPYILMPSNWDAPPGLHRRTGRPSGDGELLPGVSRLHTARVLVLGDDRMLGRLAKAYYNLRLSLQLYYIPVLAPKVPAAYANSELGELATFLGRADPWYEITVNTLCPAIHKLAEMPPALDTSRTVDPFILDVITYYVRMGTQPIYFQIYTVKIFSNLGADPMEDIFLTELKVKIQDAKLPRVSTSLQPQCGPEAKVGTGGKGQEVSLAASSDSSEGFSPRRRGMTEVPGAELSICYQKALLSHRAREVTVSLRATGLVLKALPASDTEGEELGEKREKEKKVQKERGLGDQRLVSGPTYCSPNAAPVTDRMCLNVSVMEVVKSSNLAGRSFSVSTGVEMRYSNKLGDWEPRGKGVQRPRNHSWTHKQQPTFDLIKSALSTSLPGSSDHPPQPPTLCWKLRTTDWGKDCRRKDPRPLRESSRPMGWSLLRVTYRKRAGGTVCWTKEASRDQGRCPEPSVTKVTLTQVMPLLQTVTNTFRTANIQIQSQDQRLLTLFLDKDSRRTIRDVVRFEVAPCPEPCSGAQKPKEPWPRAQKEVERTEAKSKPLLMPINTFSGIVQ
ncbi:LOW QUALITY PROTEIN: Phosphoinositide 3-kinase regulatory subunit 6 [Galemys pyrenaicus]|uniref:Phosphoinositide 3-kinase regulatory subunit 6 n=1 Tax=Galemys pyrenaicus TaxID=202257 RepID=A0A8J5ZLR5_GALPY|nr:LOW QUALITY PROTEIN: Phosphoinositide 3-kinase regulatory subunit 6 [Galemys pyrenaicus]